MTFVVGEQCIKCKHTDCVEVCPVDCFYEGPNFLVIHPDECIDCALCEPEWPKSGPTNPTSWHCWSAEASAENRVAGQPLGLHDLA